MGRVNRQESQLAMDETPLQYVPKFAGAYSNKKGVLVVLDM